jgi:hypothetical protein
MHDKNTRVLPLKDAYVFGQEHGLEQDIKKIRELEFEWESSYDSTVRRGYIIELFKTHRLFVGFKAKYWPEGNSAWGATYTLRCLRVMQRYEKFISDGGVEESGTGEAEDAAEELVFEYENDLRDFIAHNLKSIPINGKHLSLYEDKEGVGGVEYKTEVGRIDILAKDVGGASVVFELKRAKSPDEAVGQLARYMGWVKKNIANGQQVHGVIAAKEITEKLRYAILVMPNVTLLEYKVRFDLKPANDLK